VSLAGKYSQNTLLLTIGIGLAIVAFAAPGTCDSGDSITHYLFARYAYTHPENFLDHWAKPVFTFLAAPFAQLGFTGIKLFNVLVAVCTSFLVLRIAKKMDLKAPLLAPLFLFAFPYYTITIFSGLTEPLFGLVLAFGIYLLYQKRFTWSALVFSFLPFCRSEGLIVLILVGIYFLLHKRYVMLIWLCAGHGLLAVAGSFYYHNLLWVFNEIPYLGVNSYGRGGWRHFFEGAPFIFGIPLLCLLVIGLIADLLKLRSGLFAYLKKESTLVSGIFVSIFFSHVIFWKFGLFHSFGLYRVIVAVLPLAALVALQGFNSIYEWIAARNRQVAASAGAALLLYVFIFPFTPNPAAFNFKKDFGLSDEQAAQIRIAEFIKEKYPDAKICSSVNYLAVLLDRDIFDPFQFENLSTWHDQPSFDRGTIVVWDNWFGLQEYGVGRDVLTKWKHGLKEVFVTKEGSSEFVVCLQE
jgi:hypothetical protein